MNERRRKREASHGEIFQNPQLQRSIQPVDKVRSWSLAVANTRLTSKARSCRSGMTRGLALFCRPLRRTGGFCAAQRSPVYTPRTSRRSLYQEPGYLVSTFGSAVISDGVPAGLMARIERCSCGWCLVKSVPSHDRRLGKRFDVPVSDVFSAWLCSAQVRLSGKYAPVLVG